jgi:membrane associated rhomboid family serine protease
MSRITETVKHLIILNVIFYIGSQIVGPPAYELFALYFPKNEHFHFWQLVSHMFMHDSQSIMHILFNMLGLWMFGSPLEQILGRNRFLFFYFSAGIGAALIHTFVNYYQFNDAYQAMLGAGFSENEILQFAKSGSYRSDLPIAQDVLRDLYTTFNTPAVGASGALYGILVAFGMMFPNTSLFLMFIPIPIKAKYFIPGLILMDLYSGFSGSSIFGSGIAHFAHIGGALFGFLMMWYWKNNSFNDKRWY